MRQDPASPSGPDPEPPASGVRWLSRGLEELIAERGHDREHDESNVDFDVVIVGSGYGGAVAARELAVARGNKTVCVLERGREYLPGSFPSRMADVAIHVRYTGAGKAQPRGYREGLFDLRVGKDVSALLGNGVGGGSLINAGVMLMPKESVFQDTAWPKNLRAPEALKDLRAHAEALTKKLGATHDVTQVSNAPPAKFDVLKRLHPSTRAVPITVALTKETKTDAGVALDQCIRCGDCMTGCNHNAKVSLDVTLLAEAKGYGAEIYSGASVLRISRKTPGGPWELHVVHTSEPLRRRQGEPFVLRAKNVVLAAGTFGSTEILMRSQSEALRFSPKLGQQFSSNGDMIAAAYDTGRDVFGVGDECKPPRMVPELERVGPTIAGCVDLRDSEGLAIQDLGVPGPLRKLMEEVVTTSAALHQLSEADESRHDSKTGVPRDPAEVDPERVRKTLVVAMMVRDQADGMLRLDGGSAPDQGEGSVSVVWPTLRTDPALAEAHRRLAQLLENAGMSQARVLANPMWQPLPESLDFLHGGETGPLLTVHPLGGCPMGDAPATGVVDSIGRVHQFDADGRKPPLHEGLAVLDGSIIPTSLGINPALTIASVASCAIQRLRVEWGFTGAPVSAPDALGARPRFRVPEVIEQPRPTEVEIVERLSGLIRLDPKTERHIELTMRFEPIALTALSKGGAILKLNGRQGRLRIFERAPAEHEEASDEQALWVAELSGTLRVMSAESSGAFSRKWRGFWAYVFNRGLRDAFQSHGDRKQKPERTRQHLTVFKAAWESIKAAWRVASRAGTVRLFEYQLEVGKTLRVDDPFKETANRWVGQSVRGAKRLTYSRRSNPWRQLTEVTIDRFPGSRSLVKAPVLTLDTYFLARQESPLLRIVKQQDQPAAMVDLLSFSLYLMRILLHVHVWSARLPDAPVAREIARLPGEVPGLPKPTRKELHTGEMPDGEPVMVRITRYPACDEQRARARQGCTDQAKTAIETPVLLIHGYSASGTTFAHHSVQPGLAKALWDAGRDVWIVDMRSSAGMPHAMHPWTFEEVALADIPVAIDHVLAATGKQQLDVFAHCMGSAMLGMALLGNERQGERFWNLRRDLAHKIRRLAISQIPPAMVFSPANTFRAYLMRYLKHYLPLGGWQFRQSAKPGLGEQLADRLLATVPYPVEEFDRENPLWAFWRRTPWVGTRHRMDALYGRDFSLNNLRQDALDYIDDHFGPLNIDTVSQAIHFARFRSITNARGTNEYFQPEQLRERYPFPVMILHGEDNGLASVRTVTHFEDEWRKAMGSPLAESKTYGGFGHQDCLIGAGASDVFCDVVRFFDKPVSASATSRSIAFGSYVPLAAVRLRSDHAGGNLRLSVGDLRGRGKPLFGVFVPVTRSDDGRLMLAGRDGKPVEPGRANFEKLTTIAVPDKLVDETDEKTRVVFRTESVYEAAGERIFLVMLMYPQSVFVTVEQPKFNDVLTLPDAAAAVAKALVGSDVATVLEQMSTSIEKAFKETPKPTLDLALLLPFASVRQWSEFSKANPAEKFACARTFALASCQYPGGMLDRTPAGVPTAGLAGPADASYLRIARRLDGEGVAPSFLVLAGDQVYVDATAGLFDPKTLDERFDVSYENFLGARGPRSVLGRLRAYMLPDDHEITDDWEPDPPSALGSPNGANEALMRRGEWAFLRYQLDRAPEQYGPGKLWAAKEIDGFAFFLADTRTERSPRTAATVAQADLIGHDQQAALRAWLQDRSLAGPCFIASGSMVLPGTLGVRSGGTGAALRSDSWDGYPLALHRLLALVHERGSDDVVFLSGDTHRGNVTTITLTREDTGKTVVAHSIHCPALYAPYPFANAVPEDFASHDTFPFTYGDAERGVPLAAYQCTVDAWFPAPGDGFAMIRVEGQTGGGWRVDVSFDVDEQNRVAGALDRSFKVPSAAPQ